MTAAGFGRQSREARSPCERGQAPLNLDTAAAPWVGNYRIDPNKQFGSLSVDQC